jgi:hypothetical protein
MHTCIDHWLTHCLHKQRWHSRRDHKSNLVKFQNGDHKTWQSGVYVYVCMHVYIYVCNHVYVYDYECVYIDMRTHINTETNTHTHTHIQSLFCVGMCVSLLLLLLLQLRTYIRTHTYTHTYTCIRTDWKMVNSFPRDFWPQEWFSFLCRVYVSAKRRGCIQCR